MGAPTRGLLATLALALGAACSSSGPSAPPAPPATATTAPPATASTPRHGTPAAARSATGATGATGATLPDPGGPLAPAMTRVDGALTGTTLTETESCAGCHAQAAADWRSSPHAFSSFNNPVYRLAVDAFRKDLGNDASRFCGGCHDAALLVDGAMSGEVAPSDPRGHGGVACRVCHGVEEARSDGNGSYTLASTPVPIPRDGDDASLREHKARMAMAPLRTPALCGSCHRSFLSPATGNPAHLAGQDDLGAWEHSAYAGSHGARVDEPVEPAECRTCHMPLAAAPLGDAAAKDGKLRSHRFAGGNTWLAAMRGDGAQLEAVRAMLRGAASVDVAAAIGPDGTRYAPAEGAPVVAGRPLVLEVVVRNERAGHRFPGGVVDAQDTWIEVEVQSARGRRIASAGLQQQATGADPGAHVLRATVADDRGTPRLLRDTQHFRAGVVDHTLPPRDAEAVRFRLDVPADLGAGVGASDLPLRVVARLRHRSRNLTLARAVCAESKTPRGLAFAREVAARTDQPLDACAPEPVTDVAQATVWLGSVDARAPALTPDKAPWRRRFDDGLALLHGQQEVVGDGRAELEQAERLAGDAPQARAAVLHALAELSIREGRTDEALQRLEEAARALPRAPDATGEPVEAALPQGRGEALAGIWRWREAALAYRDAAAGSPLDGPLWSRLAVALGSADEPGAALEAAAHGLGLSPRDPDLLRVQALALERLGASPDTVAAAREAFARWRPPDDAPGIKSACASHDPLCALERLPVHVHAMTGEPRR